MGQIGTYLNFLPVIEEIVAQSVQLGEVDPQVGHFEQVLHLLRVGVLDGDVRGQYPEDNLEFSFLEFSFIFK